jgi:hypothetical protein
VTNGSGVDKIYFDLGPGTPVINVGSTDLPTITQAVTIDGAFYGATRVKLNGPNAGNGLAFGPGSTGSILRALVIQNFSTGLYVQAGVTVKGSVIGPNIGYGILSTTTGLIVGGVNSGTPDPCSGDCNIISGNGAAGVSGLGVTIKGNFIGVDATGTVAWPNDSGVFVSGGDWTVGGPAAGERNVISGNRIGVIVVDCYTVCAIQGNFIGTDVTGTHAVGNTQYGIQLGHTPGVTIGGTQPGEGNVISGNESSGILVYEQTAALSILGNRIGTTYGGGPLGNGGDGIDLGGFDATAVTNVRVGSEAAPAAANVIAFNYLVGIWAETTSDRNPIRRNSIHDNGFGAIVVDDGGQDSIAAPIVAGWGPVHGTACSGCSVEIFSDQDAEGATFHGTATADGSGHWTFGGTVYGPHVTATSTNSVGDTSEFSVPLAVPVFKPDARIKVGAGGALVGDNVYNTTGANQTVIASAAAGASLTYIISIQNDSSRYDVFRVRAQGPAAVGYTVRYFVGSTEYTAAIQAGTYKTPVLAPGQTSSVTALVNVTSSAAVGSNVNRLVVVTSQDPTRQDAVRLLAKRS